MAIFLVFQIQPYAIEIGMDFIPEPVLAIHKILCPTITGQNLQGEKIDLSHEEQIFDLPCSLEEFGMKHKAYTYHASSGRIQVLSVVALAESGVFSSSTDLLGSLWDEGQQSLITTNKFNAAGTCGTMGTYILNFQTKELRLVEYRAQFQCQNSSGEPSQTQWDQWPIIYSEGN